LYLNVVLEVLHQLFYDAFKFIWVSFFYFGETAGKLLLAAKQHKVNRERIMKLADKFWIDTRDI